MATAFRTVAALLMLLAVGVRAAAPACPPRLW
jgi:hypothetical protein